LWNWAYSANGASKNNHSPRNKLVSARRNWEIFQSQPFGEYWDSWAHYDQMWSHGNKIAQLNAAQGRYLKTYVGGEVAYDWGNKDIQPGSSPTQSLAEEIHRNFIINTLRWLHCTQLRWIENYDTSNKKARAGADLVQQAFGYRYILEKVAFSPSVTNGNLRVVLHVKNVGSAPFYYDWPIEASLLDPNDRSVVWKQTFAGTDIRDWLPGDGWTAPDWSPIDGSSGYKPNEKWTNGTLGWTTPSAQLPSLWFATSQYFKGGRHPIGIVTVNEGHGGSLPGDIVFDDPAKDDSLHYLP
jgi:hypothetical protein